MTAMALPNVSRETKPRRITATRSCPVADCAADLVDGSCEEHGSDFAGCDHDTCGAVLPADEIVFEPENRWWVCPACTGLCVQCGERKATTETPAGDPICATDACAREQAARVERWIAEASPDIDDDDDIPFDAISTGHSCARDHQHGIGLVESRSA